MFELIDLSHGLSFYLYEFISVVVSVLFGTFDAISYSYDNRIICQVLRTNTLVLGLKSHQKYL